MVLPQRTYPRLKAYDYSRPGYYYITIHAASRDIRLSRISGGPRKILVHLTPIGAIVNRQLLALQDRYPHVRIDKYVIMPTHLHVIIQIAESADPVSLNDLVRVFKSFSTRIANERFGTPGRKLFQTSYYDTVLRSERAYQECWLYIDGNPGKWLAGDDDGVQRSGHPV